MPLTLKELLNIPIMSRAKVRASASTLSLCSVESVSVIEIPVENFVRKNELVISTAIGCNNDPEIFKQFIQDIFESEAAALVIATGRHMKIIPEEVLQAAERQHFPIIEIPWEIRFADVTEAVLTELHNWHLTNLKQNEDLQNKLLNLFLGGFDLSDALELLSKELENPIVIIDNEGKIKGKSKHSEAFLELLTPHLQQAFSLTDIYKTPEQFSIQEDSILIYTIQSTDKLYGYILMKLISLGREKTRFTSEKDCIIRRVISILMLWFQREQAIRETEMRLRDDFVWSIAKGKVDSWDNMSSRAKSMGYNLSIPYVCIIGLIDNMENLYKYNKPVDTDYDQWLYNNINNIKEQIIWVGKHLKQRIMVTYQQDRLVIFLEIQNNQIQQISNKFLDIIDSRLKKLLPDIIISWGIGENHVGVKTFSESFMDANTALDICYLQEGPGHRSTYTKTGINRVLRMMGNNSELQEIVQLTIGELIKYDEHRGLDLINTLNAYIKNQENVSQTARALNLHRQSILYRLRKIESLTNRSLVDTDDLFLLNLCIRLWMYSAG